MTSNVDVFVGNDTLIDPDIYQLWLNGHTSGLSCLFIIFSGGVAVFTATVKLAKWICLWQLFP